MKTLSPESSNPLDTIGKAIIFYSLFAVYIHQDAKYMYAIYYSFTVG